MTTKQTNAVPFQPGHRIIYNGQFVGTLVALTPEPKNPDDTISGPAWTVEWDDGTVTGDTLFGEGMLVHLNGGPGSAAHTTRLIMINDEDLREFPGEDPKFPDGTFVQSADGSVWWMEPEFGWDCVTPGSAALIGPARLLLLGDGISE